ncbi:unnamed protein product [Effrenium voratum]|uniref:PIPK domain-containing protein n=1 Tax=Effrenium voratum TaxID=2562239 RepID=A0AA36IXU3_9DINO|nr:unnamed protein product [Effrenium voratum]
MRYGMQMMPMQRVWLVLVPVVAGSDACGHGPPSVSPPFDQKHSADVCKQCVTSSNCQWCPLSQSCGTKRMMGFDAKCMGNGDNDKPVDTGRDCGYLPPWMPILEDAYGASLEKANSDVMRCLQGRVERWKVWPDSELKSWPSAKISEFSCMSTLLREAALTSLSTHQVQLKEQGEWSGTIQARALSAEDLEGHEVHSKFCEAYHVLFPHEACKAKVFGAQEFAELRQKAASPGGAFPDITADLERSLRSGPLRPPKSKDSNDPMRQGSMLEPGFATTYDGRFTISIRFEEFKNLGKLIHGQSSKEGAIPMRSHLRRHPYSLLQRIYGLVRVKMLDFDEFCLIMANEGYNLEKKIQGGAAVTRYDLKGKSRNQKKKRTDPNAYALLNGDFQEREDNQLPLRNWQCKALKKKAVPDIGWLESHGMAGYSFFVEIAKSERTMVGCSGLPGVPLCNERSDRTTTTVAIVDYAKSSSAAMKFGGYMEDFIEDVCIMNKKESLESWQIFLVVGVFAVMLLAGALACWKYGADFMRSTQPHELRDQSLEMTARNVRGPGY